MKIGELQIGEEKTTLPEGLIEYEVNEKNSFTPGIKMGETFTLGSYPKQGPYAEDAQGLVKVNFSGLSGELSRQALQIGVTEDGYRMRSVTENNSVTVWSNDQKEPYCAKLEVGKPLGEELWEKLGRHSNVDIKTANGTLVRVRFAGGGGGGTKFLVEVNPGSERDGTPVEDFKFLN